MKRYLTIIIILISCVAKGQGSFDVGIGIGKLGVNNMVFYNPNLTYLTQKFTTKYSSKFGINASANYRRVSKKVRYDFGVQLNQESYYFSPILSSDSLNGETRIKLGTINTSFVINYSFKQISFGLGPQFKYIFKVQYASTIPMEFNTLVNSIFSTGLRLNADYTFKIVTTDVILGYSLDIFLKRNPQLISQLLYNRSQNDVFHHEIPLNYHSIKASYVF